jgi:hypothetical protein
MNAYRKFPFSPLVFLLFTAISGVFIAAHASAAGVPMPDLVFYGRVYDPDTRQQITGALPGTITVKINNAIATDDAVFKTVAALTGVDEGTPEYYVLRIKRMEAGTVRADTDRFVMPGDRIRIFVAGREVAETSSSSVLVTDALFDLRFLDLNHLDFVADNDGDGLGDAWEQLYFNTLDYNGSDVLPDGVSLQLAFALGLNPGQNNQSKLPFLRLEDGDNVAFYFRQATYATGLALTVKASDNLTPPLNWAPMEGVIPEAIGPPEGDSQVYRILVPIDRSRRFFRLEVSN